MFKYKYLLIVILISIQGCSAGNVSGIGAAAYYGSKIAMIIGHDETDAAITAAINSELLNTKIASTSDINVETYSGVVTLTGHVPSRTMLLKVISLSKKTQNVTKVISKLKITEEK